LKPLLRFVDAIRGSVRHRLLVLVIFSLVLNTDLKFVDTFRDLVYGLGSMPVLISVNEVVQRTLALVRYLGKQKQFEIRLELNAREGCERMTISHADSPSSKVESNGEE
jgi:hypothetical protein